MPRHTWSQNDIIVLKNNVGRYGRTVGCKETSKEIGVSETACIKQYYARKLNEIKIEELSKKRKRRKPMTQQEEIELANFLRSEISNNPNNLQAAFRRAAKEFGFKTQEPIMRRWYGLKGKGYDFSKSPSCRNNIGITYALIGTTTTINGKNTNKPHIKNSKSLFDVLFGWIKAKKNEKN